MSCLFGNMRKRSRRTNKNNHRPIRHLNEDYPGACVSVDQLISEQPGLIPRMSGKHTRDRISCGTCFKDHGSNFGYVHLQSSCSGDDTLQAKRSFEKVAQSFNVNIKKYRADNGRFADLAFKADIERCNQSITYCGVGAHHQNGIAESYIHDLSDGGRILLLHAKRHWPEAISTILWPYAIKCVESRKNEMSVGLDNLTPVERFANTSFPIDPSNWHTFGCPCFILDDKLQGNSKTPKWDPRACLGIYVGHSPCHAGSVALVLNPTTLFVSPQFHVVFDNKFSTVPFMRNNEIPPNWKELVEKSSQTFTDESYDLAKIWSNHTFNNVDNVDDTSDMDILNGSSNESSSSLPSHDASSSNLRNPHQSNTFNFEGDTLPSEGETSNSEGDTLDSEGATLNTEGDTLKSEGASLDISMPPVTNLDSITLRRSKRLRLKNMASTKATSNISSRAGSFFLKFCFFGIAASTIILSHPCSLFSRSIFHAHSINSLYDESFNYLHPFALAADTNDNETYHYSDMMKQPDRADFIQAMTKEVNDHEANEIWSVFPRTNVPPDANIILAVWSFKRKRFPDGSLNKHKARLTAHGGKQRWGVDYWETYSPVVNWLSVRVLMTISLLHGLDSATMDFILAFPQAKLDVDIYMEIPAGMEFPGCFWKQYVLKLNKNLYGLKQAGLNWFNFLSEGLQQRGFLQSAVDPCIMYRQDAIILIYVDDCIVFAKNRKTITDLETSLREGEKDTNGNHKKLNTYSLTLDEGIENYLGVKVTKSSDKKTFELTQPFLIDRILKLIDVDENYNVRDTPAIKPLLHKDETGSDRKCSWNYRQAVGMYNYLQATTRPDISFATHQCARFSINPKLSHKRAIRRIARYLQGTKDKGIIFRPDIEKGLECHVDAGFARSWSNADADNPDNVLSRTGYFISYAGCPLTWCSKLQTEIALSTAEAEYIALSQATREVLPLMTLLEEINYLVPLNLPTPKMKCKVFEDSTSCIAMANCVKFSPRTKHIALKYHHFRQHVKSGKLEIIKISTEEQTADLFTKPLAYDLFAYLRRKLMGW